MLKVNLKNNLKWFS